MIKFDKYSRYSRFWKGAVLSLVFMLCSCTKDEAESQGVVDGVILFGVEDIASTKVLYGDQDNGGLSASFEDGEYIGLYAFYNNFYYYYMSYLSFAESVLFTNQGLKIELSDASCDATYSPLKSWTFSTLYGTAPHTLDCIAYYPFQESYNPKYVNMVHDDGGAATLEYYYVGYLGSEEADNVVNANIDFMTAHSRYAYSSSDTEGFRSDMLSRDKLILAFTRQMASLNLQVTKPEGYTAEIVVKGLTVYFDAYTKFTQTVNTSSSVTWSEMTENYALEASVTCGDSGVSLSETSWNSTPSEDFVYVVPNLLEDDNMLFFPPATEINKIVFSITDGGVATTYTWHPHVAPIEANTLYTLNLELDPSRAN